MRLVSYARDDVLLLCAIRTANAPRFDDRERLYHLCPLEQIG
jgi:hypothetical protein